MGFDLEKRLATELNRLAADEVVRSRDDEHVERVERLKRIAAELRERLLDGEPAEHVPGKHTEVDGLVGDAVAKLAQVPGRARPFDAVPWASGAQGFDDYRVTALGDVLASLRDPRLRRATLAAADPAIAMRHGAPTKSARPTNGGTAMWQVAERRAASLYRHAVGSGEAGEDPVVDEALARIGSGQPLPLAVRKGMEAELGISFDRVRIHTDSVAASAARAVRASAFTVGEDIFFAEGTYAPDTRQGRKLLAHELWHVVQAYQGRTARGSGITISQPGEALETEAHAIAERVDRGDGRRARPRRDHALIGQAPRVSARPIAQPIAPPAPVPASGAILMRDPDDRPAATTSSGVQDERSSGGESRSSGSEGTEGGGTEGTPGVAAVRHTPVREAPSGGQNRTTVGVGEQINFTADGPGQWQASADRWGARRATGTSYSWTAPERPGSVTITYTPRGGRRAGGRSGGGSEGGRSGGGGGSEGGRSGGGGGGRETFTFEVVAPTGVSFHSVRDFSRETGAPPWPTAPQLGRIRAGMQLQVKLLPLTVSFEGLFFKEMSVEPSGRTGFFAGRDIRTHPESTQWFAVGARNVLEERDTASWQDILPTSEDGYFQWVIPNRWSFDGTGGDGTELAPSYQRFYLSRDMTLRITKGSEGGHSASVTGGYNGAPAGRRDAGARGGADARGGAREGRGGGSIGGGEGLGNVGEGRQQGRQQQQQGQRAGRGQDAAEEGGGPSVQAGREMPLFEREINTRWGQLEVAVKWTHGMNSQAPQEENRGVEAGEGVEANRGGAVNAHTEGRLRDLVTRDVTWFADRLDLDADGRKFGVRGGVESQQINVVGLGDVQFRFNLVDIEIDGRQGFEVDVATLEAEIQRPCSPQSHIDATLKINLKFEPNMERLLPELTRLLRRPVRAAGLRAARALAGRGTGLAARGLTRGALSTAGHVAGTLVEPLMIVYDFYVCMEHIASIIPSMEREMIKQAKVQDFADILASWIFQGSNQHARRLAEIDRQAPGEIRVRAGGEQFIRNWRQGLRDARQEANAAFARIRERDQAAAYREQYGSQYEAFEAFGRAAAEREGVNFYAGDVRPPPPEQAQDTGPRAEPRPMTDRPPPGAQASLEGNDEDGRLILTRLSSVGFGPPRVNSEPLTLSDGRRWIVQRAAPQGEHRSGLTEYRVTLTAAGGDETIQRTVFGRPADRSPSSEPVQADGGHMSLPAEQVHAAASRGVHGPGSSLPHFETIQRSFGHHDVTGVRAHVGGAASDAAQAIGAKAYATGDDVAFASQPDVRQAAHEAAHVVQQRGGVRLDGGVGRAGDPYEQHADAVADLVVHGQSAEGLLDTMAHRGRAGGPAVQREANAVGISRRWDQDPEELRAVQARLRDAGFPPRDGSAGATHDALRAFQRAHAAEIAQVQADSQAMQDEYGGPAGRNEGTQMTEGEMAPNDATAQALANAWPRRIMGVLLQGQDEAFAWLSQQVRSRGLPFDVERVNIVSIRGMQGGVQHGHSDPGMRRATYDDTFFVVALDEHGAKKVREFRGTTEPGGRSTAHRRDGGSDTTADPDTQSMLPDQQVIYRFSAQRSVKFGRPMLSPQVETASGEPLVIAPRADGRDSLRDSANAGDASALPAGVTPQSPDMHRRMETRDTRTGDTLDRGHGIAIHSGGGGDMVNADSTGCQVVHGDWYGNFTATLRRALDCARVRRGEATAPASSLDGTPREGEVLYSLLDGSTLSRPTEELPARARPNAAGTGTGARAQTDADPELVRLAAAERGGARTATSERGSEGRDGETRGRDTRRRSDESSS